MPDRDGIQDFRLLGLPSIATAPIASCGGCDESLYSDREIREHRGRCGRKWRRLVGASRERTRERQLEIDRLLEVEG
jgi:hypothetical protein